MARRVKPPRWLGGCRPPSLRRADRRQCDRLDLGQIELARGVIDIDADNVAGGVEIGAQTFRDFPRLRAGRVGELIVRLSVSG